LSPKKRQQVDLPAAFFQGSCHRKARSIVFLRQLADGLNRCSSAILNRGI